MQCNVKWTRYLLRSWSIRWWWIRARLLHSDCILVVRKMSTKISAIKLKNYSISLLFAVLCLSQPTSLQYCKRTCGTNTCVHGKSAVAPTHLCYIVVLYIRSIGHVNNVKTRRLSFFRTAFDAHHSHCLYIYIRIIKVYNDLFFLLLLWLFILI